MSRWIKPVTVYPGIIAPTPEQLARRADLEAEVHAGFQQGLAAKARIGQALAALGPAGEGLYRWTHERFEDYAFQTFGIAPRTVYRLISDWGAAQRVNKRLENVKIDVKMSATKAHLLPILTDNDSLRALSNVDFHYQNAVLDAITAAPEPPTPKSIKAIAAQIEPPKPTKQPPKKKPATLTLANEGAALLAARATLTVLGSRLVDGIGWSEERDQELTDLIHELQGIRRTLKGHVA